MTFSPIRTKERSPSHLKIKLSLRQLAGDGESVSSFQVKGIGVWTYSNRLIKPRSVGVVSLVYKSAYSRAALL